MQFYIHWLFLLAVCQWTLYDTIITGTQGIPCISTSWISTFSTFFTRPFLPCYTPPSLEPTPLFRFEISEWSGHKQHPYGYWHLMNLILRPLLWQGLQAPQEFSRLSPRPYTIHCPIQVHSWSPSWSAFYRKSTTRPSSCYRFLPTEQWVTSTINCYPLFYPYEIPSSLPM